MHNQHFVMTEKILIALLALLALCGCSTSKQAEPSLSYFPNLGQEGTLADDKSDYSIHIEPDDELIISVTSAVPEATAMFNVPNANPATRGTTETQGNGRLLTYVVDHEGNINFPVLGVLHVKDMTTSQVEKLIKDKVAEKVKDPYVRVQLTGYGVNVMGEVNAPRRVYIGKEKITLLEVLTLAGDLTQYARRDNVLVIRTVDGKRTYQRLNLQDSSIFSSPYFYMQQDDVVYVEPNKIKIDNSKYNQFNAYKLTMVSTIVSMASVIASLVIALTVK
jgi:polysaccharide export outer membrane protein